MLIRTSERIYLKSKWYVKFHRTYSSDDFHNCLGNYKLTYIARAETGNKIIVKYVIR